MATNPFSSLLETLGIVEATPQAAPPQIDAYAATDLPGSMPGAGGFSRVAEGGMTPFGWRDVLGIGMSELSGRRGQEAQAMKHARGRAEFQAQSKAEHEIVNFATRTREENPDMAGHDVVKRVLLSPEFSKNYSRVNPERAQALIEGVVKATQPTAKAYNAAEGHRIEFRDEQGRKIQGSEPITQPGREENFLTWLKDQTPEDQKMFMEYKRRQKDQSDKAANMQWLLDNNLIAKDRAAKLMAGAFKTVSTPLPDGSMRQVMYDMSTPTPSVLYDSHDSRYRNVPPPPTMAPPNVQNPNPAAPGPVPGPAPVEDPNSTDVPAEVAPLQPTQPGVPGPAPGQSLIPNPADPVMPMRPQAPAGMPAGPAPARSIPPPVPGAPPAFVPPQGQGPMPQAPGVSVQPKTAQGPGQVPIPGTTRTQPAPQQPAQLHPSAAGVPGAQPLEQDPVKVDFAVEPFDAYKNLVANDPAGMFDSAGGVRGGMTWIGRTIGNVGTLAKYSQDASVKRNAYTAYAQAVQDFHHTSKILKAEFDAMKQNLPDINGLDANPLSEVDKAIGVHYRLSQERMKNELQLKDATMTRPERVKRQEKIDAIDKVLMTLPSREQMVAKSNQYRNEGFPSVLNAVPPTDEILKQGKGAIDEGRSHIPGMQPGAKGDPSAKPALGVPTQTQLQSMNDAQLLDLAKKFGPSMPNNVREMLQMEHARRMKERGLSVPLSR